MAIRALPALVLALAVQAEAADQRTPLRGVSAVRIANYGTPSRVIEGREQIVSIVGELNGLRKKPWQRGDAKLSCYSSVFLLSGKKTLGEFRITAEQVVERPVEKGQSSYNLAIGEADIPGIRKLLAEIPPAKGC